MALSGNQLTRIGTIGFPGRAYSGFTAKTETVITFLTFGVLSFMSQHGQSVEGNIGAFGKSATATISKSLGVFAIIDDKGTSSNATISTTGQSVKDKL